VRFYKTEDYRDLSPELQAFARSKLSGTRFLPTTKVLTLLATTGVEAAWQDPATSVNHRAIPLPSVEIVEQAPMIAGLIRALGMEISEVISPPLSLMKDKEGRTYDVFHVEDARGSKLIPAQEDFVIPYGVRSVVGFGGLLPSGDLFALVLFSRVRVPTEAASRFKSIALDVKAILHPLARPRLDLSK
jgi:hypothetical protein